MWDQFVKWVTYYGMPVVTAYHLVIGNVFINTAADNATGFEKAGNMILTPVQYVFCGKTAVYENGSYKIKQTYDYNSRLALKMTVSLISTPISLPIGALVKAVGYLSQETKERHDLIAKALDSREVQSNIDYYKKLGLPISSTHELVDPPQYQRRPGEENKFALEKALLKDIVRIFNDNQIPYWLDAGTCLGTYRYGGVIPWDKDVDMAILMPDFQNALNLLKGLDPEKYQVQDWSHRCHPATYIRVFIKENRNHIDIYNYKIDSENKTLTYFVTCMDSCLMTKAWKTYESRFTKPTPFDTIFPLRKASFDGIEVFVPNKTKLFLQGLYGENIGPIKIYNEATGEYEKDLSHPYWKEPCVY
ncbi:MAG: LicD family protein [Rhabdochlamydiaceae bacterium]|nr:LicD family protein [Rhabdochlamydiaceae bacterium]